MTDRLDLLKQALQAQERLADYDKQISDHRRAVEIISIQMVATVYYLHRLLRDEIGRLETALASEDSSLLRQPTEELRAVVARAKRVPEDRIGQVLRALPDGRDDTYLEEWIKTFNQRAANIEVLSDAADWLSSSMRTIGAALDSTKLQLAATDTPEAVKLVGLLAACS